MNPEFDQVVDFCLSSTITCGVTRLITIDGPAGSGKTTLAGNLMATFEHQGISIAALHMDDIYDGWDQDLHHDLAHKIQAWIITPLVNKLPARFLKFDWLKNSYSSWEELPASDVLILEGVGAGHPAVSSFASCNIWIEAPQSLRLDRVVARDGESVRVHMAQWQQRESQYFDAHQVLQSANFQFVG
ncbi:MAG: AAA family ATPase [Actinobacteria bacterium]|uniref:Unannotated protein n=1 Tax=freshwater metagenome TaxID=449393 RepID=A0A6J5ZRG3_9ZZZZ|nr:AAA family ATPase [Actinomycetota bacterium]